MKLRSPLSGTVALRCRFVCRTLAVGLLVSSAAYAAPPTPREVANKVHKRVSGVFFKVARVLEGGSTSMEEDRRAGSRRRPGEQPQQHTGISQPAARNGGGQSDLLQDPKLQRSPVVVTESYPSASARNRRPDDRPSGRRATGSSESYYTADLPSPSPVPTPTSSSSRDAGNRFDGSTRKKPSDESSTSPSKRSTAPAAVMKKFDARTPDSSDSEVDQVTQPQPKYATPVPGRIGFVYPPGTKQEAANMLDVRGLNAGQKARDPRTGNVFLVP
jgi:hypothetical protein